MGGPVYQVTRYATVRATTTMEPAGGSAHIRKISGAPETEKRSGRWGDSCQGGRGGGDDDGLCVCVVGRRAAAAALLTLVDLFTLLC